VSGMPPKTLAMMIRKLKSQQARIAKDRDALRELLSEFEVVADDADEAVDSLECAIDALSRMQ
jgi:hypothetical protein